MLFYPCPAVKEGVVVDDILLFCYCRPVQAVPMVWHILLSACCVLHPHSKASVFLCLLAELDLTRVGKQQANRGDARRLRELCR